ncbi:hypothetical protein [Vibrio sp. 1CM23M]|uniref:hypothetical protein n=1 Tax=Vibrio sp. 1CM23M TaxID=2929164 RepID=UPI0020C04C50|nr:hypothetical protein [Vibrio sp. 1CM23M]MCK8072436.1 hypothetical protein [Vibrio sp. 1CM23M]
MKGSVLDKNKIIRSMWLNIIFAFIFSKMIFKEEFSVPQNRQEMKKRSKRNRFTKTKTQSAMFIIFTITLLSFSTAHSFVGQGFINADNYIVMSAFYDLFPSIKPHYIETRSAVNDLASDTIGVITRCIAQITATLLTIVVPFLTLKVILIFKADKEFDSAESSKLLLFLLLSGSMAVYSVEHETKSGIKFDTTVVQHVALTYLGSVLESLEENGNKDYDQKYLIPEIQIGNVVSQQSSFSDFTNAYLSNNFKEDDFFEFAIAKIEPESGSDKKYMVDIELGSDHLNMSFQSKQKLVNYADDLFDIDLEKKEDELVLDFFQSLADHAVKVKERTAAFHFTNGEGSYSSFDDTPSFEADYTEYCDTIYDATPINIDMKTFNKYLGVANMCASAEFMKKHYNNALYTLDSESRLRDNYRILLGDSVLDEEMTLEEIITATKTMCAGGYFACTEALQFATKRYVLNQKDVGMMTPLLREVDEFTQSFEDNSDDFMQSLSFKKSLSMSTGFTDKFSEGDPYAYINGKALMGNYDKNIHHDYSLLLDPTDLKFPNPDELTSLFVGKKWQEPILRMKTCFAYAGMVRDGYRCNTITKELRDLALSMNKMGIDLYLMTKVADVPIKMGKKQMTGKNNKNLTVGKGSFIKDNFGDIAVAGAALAGLSASENTFKEVPYYSTETVMGLAASNTFFNMFGQREVNPLNKAAKWLMLGGVSIFVMVYGLLFIFIVAFFNKYTELLVELVALVLICFVSILNGGFNELWNRVREFYFDTLILTFYSFILFVAMHYRDVILKVQVRHMLDNINNIITDSGWTNLLANIDIIVYTIIVFAVIVFKAINNSIKDAGKNIEAPIKN